MGGSLWGPGQDEVFARVGFYLAPIPWPVISHNIVSHSI